MTDAVAERVREAIRDMVALAECDSGEIAAVAAHAARGAIAEEIQSHADYAKQYEPDSAFLVGLDTAVGLIRNPT